MSYTPKPDRPMRKRQVGLATAIATSATLVGVVGGIATPAVAAGSSGLSANTHATLTVWTYLYTGTGIAEFKQEEAIFHKQFPHVTINVVQIPSSTEDSKLLAAAAAKTGPDVVQDNPDVDVYELANSGAIANMTPFWQHYAQRNQFPVSALWKYDGKIVTVQSYVDDLGIWYNKSLLSSLHLQPAKTITQLESQLPKIKASGNVPLLLDGAPGLANATWQLYPWIYDEGGSWCSLGGSGSLRAMTMLTDWLHKGYLSNNTTTWVNQDITTSGFFAGKLAYLEEGSWALGALAAQKLNFKYGSEQMFFGPNGSHVLPGGEGWAVGGFSKNKQLAFDFITDAYLSKQAGEIQFKFSGSPPTRYDLSGLEKSAPLLKPFVAAIKSDVGWPNDSQANKAETNLSDTLSGILAGSVSPATGVKQAGTQAKTDFASGSGSCSAG